MVEVEDFIEDLISRIADHSDEPMVTEDWRKRANLSQFPTVFVVERNDEVIKTGLRDGYTVYDRHAHLSVIPFIQGTSGEAAPGEMRTFIKEMLTLIYKDHSRSIGNYGASLKVIATSQTVFPPVGNNVIARELVFRVAYKEQTARLWE